MCLIYFCITAKMLPLWEFIYSTLQNGRFNPSIIKWEDEAIGKFRFVHSEKFAKLWGSVKNNDNMNYEKLSRAMRYVMALNLSKWLGVKMSATFFFYLFPIGGKKWYMFQGLSFFLITWFRSFSSSLLICYISPTVWA